MALKCQVRDVRTDGACYQSVPRSQTSCQLPSQFNGSTVNQWAREREPCPKAMPRLCIRNSRMRNRPWLARCHSENRSPPHPHLASRFTFNHGLALDMLKQREQFAD